MSADSSGAGTDPAVSIILPTYNSATLLGRSIRSVLGQSYTDFELIVIDDGSAAPESRGCSRMTRTSAGGGGAARSARRRPSSARFWKRGGQVGGCRTRRSNTGFRKGGSRSDTCGVTTNFRAGLFTGGTMSGSPRFWVARCGSGVASYRRSWRTRARV